VEVASAVPGYEYKRIRLTAIAHDIAPGSVGAYYPEANRLCRLDYQDKESGTPSYKSLPIRIRKVIFRSPQYRSSSFVRRTGPDDDPFPGELRQPPRQPEIPGREYGGDGRVTLCQPSRVTRHLEGH
jgi:hypothetical protein